MSAAHAAPRPEWSGTRSGAYAFVIGERCQPMAGICRERTGISDCAIATEYLLSNSFRASPPVGASLAPIRPGKIAAAQHRKGSPLRKPGHMHRTVPKALRPARNRAATPAARSRSWTHRTRGTRTRPANRAIRHSRRCRSIEREQVPRPVAALKRLQPDRTTPPACNRPCA